MILIYGTRTHLSFRVVAPVFETSQPKLIAMRAKMAEGMDKMAKATVNKTEFGIIEPSELADPSLLADPVYGEFARNAVDRYCELEQVVARLRTLA